MAMLNTPVAAIDLGSNTVRLLVASADGEGITRHLIRQEVTRLGQSLQPGKPFLPAAVQRTWTVLEEYRREIAGWAADRVLVGATMAVREASDGPALLERIHRTMGFDTVILSGTQEADLTAAGVLTAVRPMPETALVFDLGGRSTEFIPVAVGRIQDPVSVAMGAVGLTERHLPSDPPSETEILSLRAAIASVLRDRLPDMRADHSEPVGLVGTAGTVTTLAAMAQGLNVYRPERINNYRLDRTTLSRLFDTMIGMTTGQRSSLPGLPADRADIIVAGAAVVLEIMDFYSANELIVSDAGLLEGIWLVAAGKRRFWI